MATKIQRQLVVSSLFVLVNFTTPLMAQVDFAIDPSNLNSRYLNYLIKEGIDSVRKTKKLVPLQYDARLESAAQDHAIYLLSNPKAGHFQKNVKNKHKVSDRINFYGGSFGLCGENILQTYLIEPLSAYKHIKNYIYRNENYRQTARNIVAGWVSSPPHYKNLLEPGYRFTAVAIGVDTASNILQAVQVFSDQGRPDDFEFVSEPFTFHYQKNTLEGKLKPAANRRNIVRGKKWLKYSSTYPGWIKTNRKSVRQAFRWYHFRTRLLIENTSPAQFEDEEKYLSQPSRANQQHVLQDSLYYRVTRKELMGLLNEVPKTKLRIGRIVTPFNVRPNIVHIQIPAHWGESSTMRLVMVRKGRICTIVPFRPYPAKELSPEFPKLSFLPTEFGNVVADTTLHYTRDIAYYEVYYKRNETTLTDDDQQALLDLVPVNSKVKKIKVVANASIEGNSTINKKLFQNRANQIRIFLEMNDVLLSGATLELETRENWSLMREQISTTIELAELRGKNSEAIRQYFNQNANDSMCITLLQQQRYARVSYEVEFEEKKFDTPEETLVALNKLLAKTEITQREVYKAVSLQRKYHYLLGAIHDHPYSNLSVPDRALFAPLYYHEAVFAVHYYNMTDDSIRNTMVSAGWQPGLSNTYRLQCARYNKIYLSNEIFYKGNHSLLDTRWTCYHERTAMLNLTNTGNHSESKHKVPPFIGALEMIPELVRMHQNNSEYAIMAKQMDLYYLVMKAQSLLALNDYYWLSKVQALSNQVWQRHVKGHLMSDEMTIDYALFFSLTHQKRHAIEALTPLVKREKPNPHAWMIWASLMQDEMSERQLERELLQATTWMPVNLWLELVESDRYLSLTLLERPVLRKQWRKMQSKTKDGIPNV
jgi:uncharacterized protein YkwD